MKAFLDRPIEGDWPYLWIDATYLKVRQNGRIVSVAVIVAVTFAVNKWLIAHKESGLDKDGAFIGLKGENLTL